LNIIHNGKKYHKTDFASEADFDDEIASSSKTLFGADTIYIAAKKKLDSKTLGGTIPDGFFFDFSDKEDPQFYVVEVELAKHSFFSHVFPQITKFFALFNNPLLQQDLAQKLFSIVSTDNRLQAEFRKYLSGTEIYKFLTDVIDSSQNILLISDNEITELTEIKETYSDTWGKMVLDIQINKYSNGSDTIFTLNPEYETLQLVDLRIDDTSASSNGVIKATISEKQHLDAVTPNCRTIYETLKSVALSIDDKLVFNPQRYYISIRSSKNIAYFKLRKNKIRLIVMLPEMDIRKIISGYTVSSLSVGVQDFYHGPCATVEIDHLNNISELETLLRELISKPTWLLPFDPDCDKLLRNLWSPTPDPDAPKRQHFCSNLR